MQNAAIYSGTFDPLTYGHIDLVRRAARLFDKLTVGIAASLKKSTLFSLQERLYLAEQVFADMPRVEVVSFDGLLTDFAKERGAHIIVRGLRVVSDFDHEFQMASMNRMIDPGLETIFLAGLRPWLLLSIGLPHPQPPSCTSSDYQQKRSLQDQTSPRAWRIS